MSRGADPRRPWIRSYAARRGRHAERTQSRIADLLPSRQIPPGPLDPQTTFGRRAPLVLEIGCGHGAAARAYARSHPDHDLLAVDVHTPGIARMLAEAAVEPGGLPNLRVATGDAVLLLTERIGSGSLAAVHLFFPDPWHKRKHAKRRFVSAHTLGLIADRLAPGGLLRVATDRDFYADHVLSELAAHGGWQVRTGVRPAWRPTDGFEAKGRAAGRTISEITAVRC